MGMLWLYLLILLLLFSRCTLCTVHSGFKSTDMNNARLTPNFNLVEKL